MCTDTRDAFDTSTSEKRAVIDGTVLDRKTFAGPAPLFHSYTATRQRGATILSSSPCFAISAHGIFVTNAWQYGMAEKQP